MLRSQIRPVSLVILLGLAAGVVGVSCQHRADDCMETLTCVGTGGQDGTGGDSTSGGSAGEGGEGGQGGLGGQGGEGGALGTGGAAPCDPTEEQCTDAVILHVSPVGSDEADGSAHAPLETIEQALAHVEAAVEAGYPAPLVYLCATEGAYEETLTIGAQHGAVGIYGGFACDDFAMVAERAVVLAETAAGHRIEGASGVTLGDVRLESPNATADGASSYGLWVVESQGVRIVRSELVAGEGARGADGEGYTLRAQSGAEGNIGKDACEAGADETNAGGPAVTTSCNNVPTVSVGGKGGAGGGGALVPEGGNGATGQPDGGTRGNGEDGAACSPGGPGEQGANGTPGQPASALGQLNADGYVPSMGGNGTAGAVGEGGGGGGGAAKGPGCETGASGGSGGGGGCPGAGGGGAQSGGGSFALVSLEAQVELSAVTAIAAVGGGGGTGGDRQRGGDGGSAGEGGDQAESDGLNGCKGGDGGPGGNGGSGAGGSGGPSIGVAYIGDAPVGLENVTADLPAIGASGGNHGTLNTNDPAPAGEVRASWAP